MRMRRKSFDTWECAAGLTYAKMHVNEEKVGYFGYTCGVEARESAG